MRQRLAALLLPLLLLAGCAPSFIEPEPDSDRVNIGWEWACAPNPLKRDPDEPCSLILMFEGGELVEFVWSDQ